MATEASPAPAAPAAPVSAPAPIELTAEDKLIRDKAWNGFVPVCFTICEGDTIIAVNAEPIYLLANRLCTLTSIALDDKYSKSLFRSINGTIPEIWFEDKKTKTALKWYLPLGVLYDIYKNEITKTTANATNTSSDHFDDDESPIWDIIVHHSEYPDTITHWINEDNYKGSYLFTIKESSFVKFGDQKVTNALTKEQTDSIANMSARSSKYTTVFRDTLDGILGTNAPKRIPTRFCSKEGPFIQQHIDPDETLRDACVKTFGEDVVNENGFEEKVLIHGIVIPFDVKMAWIYAVFAYTDNFLYISVDV